MKRVNEDYLFEATGKSGVPILVDNTSTNDAKGASPMELLLMGVGGCSAIDVIHILKKQRQVITDYTIEVTGDREDVKEAKPFSAINVHINIEGNITPDKVLRAAQLSFEKYCSFKLCSCLFS